MTDEELIDELENPSGPNEPEKLPLAGCSGPREMINATERRRRREAMSALLSGGASVDEIIEVFEADTILDKNGKKTAGFAMREESIRRLMREVWASWNEEDAEQKQHYKGAAIRRILKTIRKAGARQQFSAVAMLEKQLAEIQGTNEPKHVRIEGDFRLSAAVMRVLGETDPVEVRRMIAEEGRRAALGVGDDAKIIDVSPAKEKVPAP